MKEQKQQKEKQQKSNQKQQLIKEYGLCTFWSLIFKKDMDKSFINFCTNVTLKQPIFGNELIKKYLAQVRYFRIFRLKLKAWRQPTIIKLLANIKFENLIQINLDSNNIDNIQALSQLQCPKLNYLWMVHNNITSVKPLLKLKFNQILSFNLQQNKIFHIDNLERLFLNKFSNLMTQGKTIHVQQQDSSYLARFESTYHKNQVYKLQDAKTKKIVQRKVTNVLYYNDLKKLQKEINLPLVVNAPQDNEWKVNQVKIRS